jgi:transposase
MNTEQIKARKFKGQEIYKTNRVRQDGNCWIVTSSHSSNKYRVDLENQTCDCPDFQIRKVICKHLYGVKLEFENSSKQNQIPVKRVRLQAPKRQTYSQPNWSAYHKSQVFEKAQFRYLLFQLCQNIETPAQETGRPRCTFNDLMFAMVFKVYSCFSSRRFMTDLRDSEKYLTKVPHYNSVINAFGWEEMTDCLQYLIELSSMPMSEIESDFAIDSTGISSSRFMQWHHAKYKDPKLMVQKNWVKMHICTGTMTNIVTAVEITDRYGHDATEFVPLVNKTAQNFNIDNVSADRAYASGTNLQAVLDHGGMPYLAMKKNANAQYKQYGQVWKNMYHYYSLNHEKFLSHYSKRANVETTFSMIKAKFGDAVRNKTQTAQINEVLCKILAHNICVLITSIYELGLKPKFWSEL